MKHKRNDPMCDPWRIPKGMKNAISIFIAFCLDFLMAKVWWLKNHVTVKRL